jgi:hypothetical protein
VSTRYCSAILSTNSTSVGVFLTPVAVCCDVLIVAPATRASLIRWTSAFFAAAQNALVRSLLAAILGNGSTSSCLRTLGELGGRVFQLATCRTAHGALARSKDPIAKRAHDRLT